MNFGEALELLKEGCQVTRLGWSGADQRLEYHVPVAPTIWSSEMRPYILIWPVDGRPVPWVASQTDMLAEDWMQV